MLYAQQFARGVRRHGITGAVDILQIQSKKVLRRAIKRGTRGAARLIVVPVVWTGDILYRRGRFTFGTFSVQRVGHFAAEVGIQLANQALVNRISSGSWARRDVRVIDPAEPVSNGFLMSIVGRAFWLAPKLWFLFALLRSAGVQRPWFIDPDGPDNRDKLGVLQGGDGRYPFSPGEDEMGKNFLESIGWTDGQPIVCLLVRDAQYLNVTPGLRPSDVKKSWDYHNFRDSEIGSYVAAAQWIAEQGAIVLRMGKSMARPFVANHPNVIDYAFHEQRSDFLDVWLHANCNLCITTGTGPDVISAIHLRPILFVNFLPVMSMWSWTYAVTAPKFLVWKDSGRPLSLDESLNQIWLRGDQYDYNGINFRDLDANALLAIFAEAWQRLDGSWIGDANDVRRNSEAWAALEANHEYANWHGYRHPEARFSSVWLRQLERELALEDRPKNT